MKGQKPGWVGSRDFRLNEFKIHKMCFFCAKHVMSLRRMAESETKQEFVYAPCCCLFSSHPKKPRPLNGDRWLPGGDSGRFAQRLTPGSRMTGALR